VEFNNFRVDGSWFNFDLGMIPLTYILLNLIQAVWHSYLIKKNRLILSAQKLIEYSIISILAGVILKWVRGCQLLPLILFCVLSRIAFFDGFLNILRGKSVLYEGEIKKKKSFYDWFEKQTALPIVILRLIYLVLFIGYLLIYYL